MMARGGPGGPGGGQQFFWAPGPLFSLSWAAVQRCGPWALAAGPGPKPRALVPGPGPWSQARALGPGGGQKSGKTRDGDLEP